MERADDLSEAALAEALGGRAFRVYPALLSTEADALAWARAGAPHGAVIAAGYQASPRGRAGLEWHAPPGESLAFSLVVRPRLPAPREGWLYVIASLGLADALDTGVRWPDEAVRAGERAGAIAVTTGLGAFGVEWAVVNVLVVNARPPRAPLLAAIVAAFEARAVETSAAALADYLRRCETIGRDVRARLIPMGPGGVVIEGRAATVKTDGALVVETADERRLAIRPQSLGLLE